MDGAGQAENLCDGGCQVFVRFGQYGAAGHQQTGAKFGEGVIEKQWIGVGYEKGERRFRIGNMRGQRGAFG